jgi:hypothetical protein
MKRLLLVALAALALSAVASAEKIVIGCNPFAGCIVKSNIVIGCNPFAGCIVNTR